MFFFFKQKTAYEMRISDWSSDVCSSDLMSKSIKISCKNLWHLFGKGGSGFLNKHRHDPSDEQLASAGLVAAVRDVSFDVHAGEILVIMGLSGSGKSTLIRCLTRLIKPNAGQVLFDGVDL